MKNKLSGLFALIGWFALTAQFFLMMETRQVSVMETVIKFFSFFTILTNLLVTIYFTVVFFSKTKYIKFIHNPGTLTAITIYITIVGLVYQVALRHLWKPEGLQLLTDELLHSVMPILAIIFWCMYEITKPIKYTQIATWAIYPLLYLVYILIRGNISGYYPYPFIDITTIGIAKALTNAAFLILFFILISALFIFIGKSFIKR